MDYEYRNCYESIFSFIMHVLNEQNLNLATVLKYIGHDNLKGEYKKSGALHEVWLKFLSMKFKPSFRFLK